MSNPYTHNLKKIVFDIETMGLYPGKDMIINAGFCDPETLECVQLFAETPGDEERLLRDILSIISEYDVVITYNGDRFDLPFIQTRCRKYSIDFNQNFWSIDMYRYLRKYWPMAERMAHLNQKSVEIALGLADKRSDEIGGGECIPLYEEYLLTSNQKAKDLILLHNADDIKQLAKIYNASIFLPYDKIAFERGFALKAPERIQVKSIRFDKNALYVQAEKRVGGIPSSIFEEGYELEYDCFLGEINIKVFYFERENGTRYVDLHRLPCDIKALENLEGFHSGYLVLADAKEVRYREVNNLVISILSHEGLF